MRILTSLTIVVCAALQTLCAQSASQSAGSAAPIGVYNVVSELPGMGRPVDTAAVAARRRALARRIGRGSILVPASHERNIEQDYVQDNDFRQNNTFFYLTELETQDAWLLLTARGPDTLETVLLLPPRTPSRERWTGLRRAVDISVAGHIAAMRAARPGMYEYELEAALEDGFRRNGADRLGYPSIVGSGPNSTTLHYDVNRRKTENGDLVVIDAAAEWGQYTADVTRTFPVNGKFTPRQKAIYDLVLGAQQAAFDAVRPGITMRELDGIARRYMHDHSGNLCGPLTCDDREFFNHGLGHPIGMDVHDVGISRPLEPGMVVTLEPGIYIQSEKLGVRIEDDVLVTAKGGEWLSAGAPRTAEAIERVMQGR